MYMYRNVYVLNDRDWKLYLFRDTFISDEYKI